MARFVSQVNVGENLNVTFKSNLATLTDADVNKPVTLTAADTVTLATAGQNIYGFINSVERGTADGKVLLGIQVQGRRKVTLSGTAAVGALVEAATNTAAATALGQDWGIVQAKADVAADLATDADGTAISVAVNAILAEALLPQKQWKVISGAGTTGTNALIELQ